MRVLAALALLAASPVFASPPLRLPLVALVTRAAGEPVVSAADLAQLLDEVNTLYQAAAVRFVLVGVRALDEDGALTTHRQRRAFAGSTSPRAINVVFVESIVDPEPSPSTARAAARLGRAPSGWLNGAEVPMRERPPGLYLLVRAGAGAMTLAHELGHFLGEGHHPDAENVMAYGDRRRAFDDAQLRAMRRHAERDLARGALAPAP
jgi:hypothetical protein